ncbi:nucleotide-binding universal stress UspA family protein [Actinoplanes octamycinicus]|uniref:Nucleotide-binding universal stress UspA family protein n=1 Tax=Actinoplanes octamycinicus TaxID=135948 RepID=A0A7W7GZS4_9ACTN|nr:universal stress protein [Actinoplanes octamycinicus]MBB4741254.1 nucleotide-binding universal stress UspA family protein [Actinoplanes octamycinicus]GIE56162.1 universal stress protein [Actinoplanes octamycinicus]
MRTTGIVVGTDGTDTSDLAVDWAAREAHRRGVALRIVHAFDWDWRESRFEVGNEYVDAARQQAEGVIAAAVERVQGIAPDLAVQTFTLIGQAVPRLLESARGAQLMVLGSRGRGGFAGMLLGSTSQRVATHAPCPVVVVGPQPAADDVPTATGDHRSTTAGDNRPIAAGVDDSPSADLVLETVFTMADAQGAPIRIVHACPPVIPPWLTPDSAAVDADRADRLAEQLEPWRSKFPDVPVDVVLSPASPPAALVEASRTARLVIVGSHGHGLVTGTLVGSTSLQLLHHAACPVYVTRPLPE